MPAVAHHRPSRSADTMLRQPDRGSPPSRVLQSLLALLALLVASLVDLTIAPVAGASDAGGQQVEVVVLERVPATDDAEAAVRALGGEIGAPFGTVGGFVATVPQYAVGKLRQDPSTWSVTIDRDVELTSYEGFDPVADWGSTLRTAFVIGAQPYHEAGYWGQGIDIAVIDSGIATVPGLNEPGHVLHGPDLSFESQVAALEHKDAFGHGTHMAGIIGGNLWGWDPFWWNTSGFQGIAPKSRLVSVKVAAANGATDVSQILAAIDWVIANKSSHGLNIRVLNLSFGTDGVAPGQTDPLVYAAEQAWRHGIVVVAAAGNGGPTTTSLANPAVSPHLLAVGSSDHRGTPYRWDDKPSTFSSRGSAARGPDLVAPGEDIVSLRVEGSYLDQEYPGAGVGSRMFRGSGTSMATAATSGAVAVVLSRNPNYTPDQVKALLVDSATPLWADEQLVGAGALNLDAAFHATVETSPIAADGRSIVGATGEPWSDGTGSLDASRGSVVLEDGGVPLTGDTDIFGDPIDMPSWRKAAAGGTAFSAGAWLQRQYTGTGFDDRWIWDGIAWTDDTWAGTAWVTSNETDHWWAGNRWAGNRWAGNRWAGNRWAGNRWAGWATSSWAGAGAEVGS